MLWDDITIGYIKGTANLHAGRKEFDYIHMTGFAYSTCFSYKFIISIPMTIHCIKCMCWNDLDMIDMIDQISFVCIVVGSANW